MQWSGTSRQQIVLPWFAIRDFQDVESFAQKVDQAPRLWRNYSTAIGEALLLGLDTMRGAPDCDKRVIDVSGDGASNEGFLPAQVKPLLTASDVVVNGLVIDDRNEGVVDYYKEHVITGPGAFVVAANSFADYPERIREKLVRELTKQFAAR
jgi:Ca-activated chloride channel family protein